MQRKGRFLLTAAGFSLEFLDLLRGFRFGQLLVEFFSRFAA